MQALRDGVQRYEWGCGGGRRTVSEATLLLRGQEKACSELKPLYLQLFEPLHVPPFYILNLVL